MNKGKRKTISQYSGTLTPSQIAAGMNAAARNASRLLEDAKAMLEAKRYPTACALAILSIEESGKTFILRGLSIAPNEQELKRAWKDYRNHQAKNVAWIITELAVKGARKLEDLAPIFDQNSDHPAVLDTVKQIAFYTDCYGDAHWSVPERVIDEDLARVLVMTAKVLIRAPKASTREIELWIKHMAPVRGTPATKSALKAYWMALIEAGLSEHTLEELSQFLGIEFDGPNTIH